MEEVFPIVERREGRPVIRGLAARSYAHDHGIWHLSVQLVPVALDADGEDVILYLHRRSLHKRSGAGLLDFCGGHVGSDDAIPPQREWEDAEQIEQLCRRAALREAREEIRCEPAFLIEERHVHRFGCCGALEADGPMARDGWDREISTAYLVGLPPGERGRNVHAWDTDATGERALDTSSMTWPELLSAYRTAPENYADGLGRIMEALLREPAREKAFRAAMIEAARSASTK